jgi:uncharacterized membrane-anchored protein YhcB (DUF1043 family)
MLQQTIKEERELFQKQFIEMQEGMKKQLLDIMNKQETKQEITEMYRKFNTKAQELMIEFAITSIESGIQTDYEKIKQYIIDELSNFIIRLPEKKKIISTFLFEESDTLRCFDTETKTWDDCGPNITKQITLLKSEDKNRLENNPYGYYGMYEDSSGVFSIRDVSKEEYKSTNPDKRKIKKGLNCNSWTQDNLIKLIHTLKIKPPENYEKVSVIGDKLTQKIKKTFGDNEKTLQDIAYWYQINKDELCKQLYSWFQQEKLIERIITKKT